jgi:hypothetical protein
MTIFFHAIFTLKMPQLMSVAHIYGHMQRTVTFLFCQINLPLHKVQILSNKKGIELL